MIKTKDGYAKLISTTYSGSVSRVLLSNGGDHILGNSNGNIPLNNGTVNTNLNADMLDGLHIHTGRNKEANKIVRTDASGYILAGWINTTSGDIGTGTINKIYCSNDDYIRYKTPANFFPTLANDGNQISITIGSQNRKLTVNYASFTKTLDKVFLPSSTSNAANTAWCKFARITFNNSAWSAASGYLFFGGGENPDNRAILVYHFRSGNTATTLSTANLYWLVKSYNNATVIAVKVADNVYDLYTNNSGTYLSPCIYHMSAFSSRFTWSIGNWTTTKPTAAYTSSDIGIVNYANSAGNADTIDNYHANGLLTALSNSNNGVSITVGGTTKSISNISVNYASSAGTASKWATARTLTLTGSVTGSASIDGSGNVSLATTTNHSHSWNSITNKPCTLISYSRDGKNIDANNWRVKECSLIEIRGTELTYSNLAMSGYNSFFNFWTPDGIACTQFQIGNKAFYYRSKQSGSATITTNWCRVMDSNNCSVSKSGETLTVKINGTSQSLINTWRGILDNLTSSTNTTQSLSAKLGYLLANGYARDNTKLPLSGGTMTGVIKSTFKSGTWINGVTNAVVKGEYTDYGAILSMPVKDGRVSISSYPSNDNYIYFGYATSAYINAGTNDFNKKMYWDAANNKLVADTFLGALLGNATTATTATKLSTSSVGNASLPVYFSNGIPVACTKSSIFSNLSNNGDQLSVTVAGYNRLLTVAFASRADSAVDADYASSADWAEDSLHASSADSATNADYATNADTLDGHHASEFSLSNHIHTLKLESTTGTSSITLTHGGKYKLTAGGGSVIFTLPTDITSIAFSGGHISSSGNTLTQADHSIAIGGQTETAGYSTCNIINNLSINSLSSSSTTNLTAQITVNGITSALKTITQLHSRFWDVTSNSATSNISPGNYSATITEVQGNASGITGNLPTTSWYHVYTAAGHNTKYATLLALGMTTDGIWYRKYSNSSWGSWLTVLHSGNIGNYYWANISISSTRNTNTTPQFSKVMINTTSTSYQLNVNGDSYTTGWSRAKNGFYCEGNGIYFTHNGTKGEIAVKNNNEFCWGSNSDKLYFNYAAPLNGTTVKNYIWNAGSSDTYASHTTGDIILGSNSNSNYQLKRAGYEVSWYNGRDRAIIRQTSAANGYSVVISSKTTNGSWEIGNNSDNLYFTYITDTNYNSATNVWGARLYFSSSGSIYATHFYENSDIRYKKILKNLSINSNTIANLPLFDFEWIENNAIGTGTSALAVQQILPNLVSGTDRLTLDYGALGTIAGITACKELVILKSELLQLREKVKLLEDKLLKYTQLEN